MRCVRIQSFISCLLRIWHTSSRSFRVISVGPTVAEMSWECHGEPVMNAIHFLGDISVVEVNWLIAFCNYLDLLETNSFHAMLLT